MHIILPTYAGLIIHMQACSCMHMILPKNPNPSFFDFVSDFTCSASALCMCTQVKSYAHKYLACVCRLLYA